MRLALVQVILAACLVGCRDSRSPHQRAAEFIAAFTNEVAVDELQAWTVQHVAEIRRSPEAIRSGPLTNLSTLKLLSVRVVEDVATRDEFLFLAFEEGLIHEGVLVGAKGAKTGQGRVRVMIQDGVYYIFDTQ